MLHRPSLQALISMLDCCRPALQIVGRISSSCTIRGRWKIGRLNGRYLCGEECIALNILNGMTRQRNGFTYAEAQIQECRRLERRRAYGSVSPIREAVEVGRDSLGLEMPRRNLDGSTTYRPKNQAGMDEHNDAEEDPLTSR